VNKALFNKTAITAISQVSGSLRQKTNALATVEQKNNDSTNR